MPYLARIKFSRPVWSFSRGRLYVWGSSASQNVFAFTFPMPGSFQYPT